MFHSWKSSVISFAVVLSLIAAVLIVVFVYKKRGLQMDHQRINEERETLLLREESTESATSLLRKRAVNVTLDADSAHPRLIVSHDGKQVRCENTEQREENQEEQNNTFDNYLGVVGTEGFSSGCFYYEVQVEGMIEWYVGVARESVSRKGPVSLIPQNGYWTVAKGTFSLWACEDSYVLLSLSVKPARIGVFVDYEEGRVSFYDVKSMTHIYSFNGQSFNEKIYPFVSLGYKLSKNSSPLIFCSDLSPLGDSYKNT
ncbi:butyrophilin subfamily 2 member A2-like [Triplophysa rosa]|uniref:Butyrophilin subfamily 1 member A1-like n=1 Tax=Triplophysa rosa TaxID=992332 RepID=A0A9W7T3Y8_TRIRA|nr:butyrophilin subfamily 2 member A2-like [Triplophysa rosa]KAI7790257.1 putative butyrophilin subfamily 1 member A1-like [Triplophysa rosa]